MSIPKIYLILPPVGSDLFSGVHASHTLEEMGDYGGIAPVIPHFFHSARRCAPKIFLRLISILNSSD